MAIEQGQVPLNYKKWLTYWTVYNAFSFLENIFNGDSSFWRPYSFAKFIVLVLYFLPVPWNASEGLYNTRIYPFLQNRHATIIEFAQQTWKNTNKGAITVIVLLWAYMKGFRFLCSLLGFVLPAFFSMISLMLESEMSMKCWLAYWIVFSSCTMTEYVLSSIPLYYPIKFLLLGWYMVEPLLRNTIYFEGQKLILYYRPVTSAITICHNIIQSFLESDQRPPVSRANLNQGYPGILDFQNVTLNNLQDTVYEANQIPVNPQEVNLQMSSSMVQAVLEMDVNEELIKNAIKLKLAKEGPGYSFTSAEDLLNAVYDLSLSIIEKDENSCVPKVEYSDGDKTLLTPLNSLLINGNIQNPLEVMEENLKLKDQRMCKICMTGDVEVVFVPCGHLVCCKNCSTKVATCPICRKDIKSTQRAYMS